MIKSGVYVLSCHRTAGLDRIVLKKHFGDGQSRGDSNGSNQYSTRQRAGIFSGHTAKTVDATVVFLTHALV